MVLNPEDHNINFCQCDIMGSTYECGIAITRTAVIFVILPLFPPLGMGLFLSQPLARGT